MEQRRVEELIARYRLEPTPHDIYVEGPSDPALFEWFLSENGADEVAVYNVSTVLLPAETMDELGLPNNNKGRIIGLAYVLDTHINEETGPSDRATLT